MNPACAVVVPLPGISGANALLQVYVLLEQPQAVRIEPHVLIDEKKVLARGGEVAAVIAAHEPGLRRLGDDFHLRVLREKCRGAILAVAIHHDDLGGHPALRSERLDEAREKCLAVQIADDDRDRHDARVAKNAARYAQLGGSFSRISMFLNSTGRAGPFDFTQRAIRPMPSFSETGSVFPKTSLSFA